MACEGADRERDFVFGGCFRYMSPSRGVERICKNRKFTEGESQRERKEGKKRKYCEFRDIH